MGQCCCCRGRRPGDEESCPEKGGEKEIADFSRSGESPPQDDKCNDIPNEDLIQHTQSRNPPLEAYTHQVQSAKPLYEAGAARVQSTSSPLVAEIHSQHPHQPDNDNEYLKELNEIIIERDRCKKDYDFKEEQAKEYEKEIALLRSKLKKSRGGGGDSVAVDQSKLNGYEANIRQLEDEKTELANKVKELEYEKNRLGKKNEEMAWNEDIAVSEVRKEKDQEIRDKERELAEARKAIKAEKQRADQEMRKKEELQEMLNEQDREKVEQLKMQNETVADLKEQLAQKEKGLTTAQATVAVLEEQLAQKGEGIAIAQAEQAQPPHVTENKALEELKEEHQRILKEQKEKKKHLKDKVKKLEQAETLRQSEAVDAGKREAELEKELNSLKGRVDSMKEGLRQERLKMKQLEDQKADEKAEQERIHQQEMMREKAQVKALTDERAGLIMRHNQEMTRLKVQLTDAQTRAQESEKRLSDIKKDNDTLKTEKEVEMTHMRNTLEEKEKKLTRLLHEKEEELKRAQDERSQTVKQLRQQLEAAVKKANDNEKKINELEEMLVLKDVEISTYMQDFESERKDRERINSKLVAAEEQKEILSNMLAEKEKELTEAKKDAKKWTKKNKELEQLETDRMKEMEEEVQVLTAQVNAYSRECEKQKGLVAQNQERHKTEIQELNEKLTNEQKSKQQLESQLTTMKQQVDSLTASKESLLTAYNQENAMANSLQQQLNRAREELEAAKEKSTIMKKANEVLSHKLRNLSQPQAHHHVHPHDYDTNTDHRSLDSITQHRGPPHPSNPPYQKHPPSSHPSKIPLADAALVAADGGQERGGRGGGTYRDERDKREGQRHLKHNASDSKISFQQPILEEYRQRSYSSEEETRRQVEERRRKEQEKRQREEEKWRIEQEKQAEREKLNRMADEALGHLDRYKKKDPHPPNPSPLASPQNVHKQRQEPVKQEKTVKQEQPVKQQGGAKKRRESDDSDDDDIKENILLENIDDEIHDMAEEVRKMSRRPDTQEVLFDDGDSSLPYDPNLVCPKCGRQYRVGEIRKLKRHMVEFCTGKR